MHLFGPFEFPDSQIERADEAEQLSFDRGLSGHVLADAFGRFIKDLLEHGGVLAEGRGRPNPLQHVLEELRDLPALGGFSLRLASRLPLAAKRNAHHCQSHNQKNHDQGDATEQKLVAHYRFLKLVESAWWTRRDGLIGKVPLNVERQPVRCFVAACAILLQSFHY